MDNTKAIVSFIAEQNFSQLKSTDVFEQLSQNNGSYSCMDSFACFFICKGNTTILKIETASHLLKMLTSLGEQNFS